MPINRIAVIGSGLMGHGIAQVAATSGQEVTLIDISDELLEKAMQKIIESLNRLSEKGKLKEGPESILNRITTITSLSRGVINADYVVEAVPEDINVKRKIISEADDNAPKHTMLATNTSGLSINIIAEATKRPEKVIGMHWMNPPQLMKLVEIIKNKHTDEETLQTTLELCDKYGKETVIAQRDVWFFLAARARNGWSIEANMMYLRQEASTMELDAVARYRVGIPMGEFEFSDFTGAVEIRTKGLESLEKILKINPDFEPWPPFPSAYRYLARELWAPMRDKGLCGVKTGKGFYDYAGGKYVKPNIPEEMAEKVDPLQLLAPAANMAAWCVSNGVGSIEDVNKSYRLAFGWPKGIFDFVDECGADKFVSVLHVKENKAPDWLRDFYRVDPLLANWES